MAGPLVRLQNYFLEIQKTGTLPKKDLTFRRGDYIQNLAPLVNDALKKLAGK
jgi:hypothetical protein